MMNACFTLSGKDTSILDPLPKRRHCNKTVQCKIAGPKANKRTQTRFDTSRSPTRWPEKAGNIPEVKSKSESLKKVHLKLFPVVKTFSSATFRTFSSEIVDCSAYNWHKRELIVWIFIIASVQFLCTSS